MKPLLSFLHRPKISSATFSVIPDKISITLLLELPFGVSRRPGTAEHRHDLSA